MRRVALILEQQSKQVEINRIKEMIKVIDEIIKDGEDKQ